MVDCKESYLEEFDNLTKGFDLRDDTVIGLGDRDDFFAIRTNCPLDVEGSHRFGDVNPDRRISEMYSRAHSTSLQFSNFTDNRTENYVPSSEPEAEVLRVLLGVRSHEPVWVETHGVFVDSGVV